MKFLFFAAGGFVVYYKRLERGRFTMPVAENGATSVTLDGAALAMLLEGIDLGAVKRPALWTPKKSTSQSTQRYTFEARHDRSSLLPLPLPDDPDDHGCAWRDYALKFQDWAADEAKKAEARQAKLAELEAANEALRRAFERRSENTGKMPKLRPPPRTKEEVAEHRRDQEQLRAIRW